MSKTYKDDDRWAPMLKHERQAQRQAERRLKTLLAGIAIQDEPAERQPHSERHARRVA